jgi:hypothetical protein
MPCSHILAVLEDIEYLTPSLVHIRWWKHFNYLFKEKLIRSETSASTQLMKSFKNIQRNHFDHKSGMYKGILGENTDF